MRNFLTMAIFTAALSVAALNPASDINNSEEMKVTVTTVENTEYAADTLSFAVEAMEPVTMYITGSVNLRSIPDRSGKYLGTLKPGAEVTVIGVVKNNPYNGITYYVTNNNEYIHGGYISSEKPAGKQLAVTNIKQNPDLPNGCEITSLTIVLNYKGYNVDKCVMSDNYLPKWPDLSGDPEYYYLREPRSNGFYCFATCLGITIDNYNTANGTAITYSNLTGSDVSALYNEIENGNPVVVWGTLKWRTPRAYSNGLYSNLHCMVLSGYTDTTVTIEDPIYGAATVISRSTFETVWTQMGSRALVVY